LLENSMHNKCDLYLCETANSLHFKYLKIYDKNFVYEEDKTYRGYIGVNVERIKLIVFVSELREKKFAPSVPLLSTEIKKICQ
jgi:hypothetical protein